jgi:cell division transport system permease protein
MISSRFGLALGNLPVGYGEAARFLPWIVALMVYVAGLGGIGLIALDGTVRAAERSLATSLTLQVPADASNARVETVLALLRQTKGILAATVLDAKETARLLEPWLGPKVPLDQLPVPKLIDLRIDPAMPPDLAPLRQRLASVVPEAELDDHRPGLVDQRALLRRVEGVLATAIAVALGLIALSTVFAVRAALQAERSSVELVHLLGAADASIARRFATRCFALGVLGGAIGAAAALLAVALLGGAGIVATPIAARIADWRVWGVLTASMLAAGLIAAASAHLAVRHWLLRMP